MAFKDNRWFRVASRVRNLVKYLLKGFSRICFIVYIMQYQSSLRPQALISKARNTTIHPGMLVLSSMILLSPCRNASLLWHSPKWRKTSEIQRSRILGTETPERERSIFSSQVVVLVLHNAGTTAIANIWQINCKSLLAPRGNIIITWLSVC